MSLEQWNSQGGAQIKVFTEAYVNEYSLPDEPLQIIE